MNWWITPIPRGSDYAPSGIMPATGHVENGVPMVTYDNEFICDDQTQPLKLMTIQHPPYTLPQKVHVSPRMSHDGSWNGCWAFLAADNKSLYQGQVLTLSAGGNPTSWFTEAPVDITSEFFNGGHGGSGLSTYAGSLRKDELTQDGPITHKLKINLYGRRFLSQAGGGYTWPATRADSGYATDLYPGQDGLAWFTRTKGDDNYYGSSNSLMRMGTLLAIPRRKSLSTITEPRARKLAVCLRNYGAVVVDNTAVNIHAVVGEQGAFVTDASTQANKDFHLQLMKVFSMLRVVL